MSNDASKPSRRGQKRTGRDRPRQVTFGSVTVRTRPADPQQVRENVVSGQSALKRARDPLLKAGIQLPRNKSVPLYHVDPDRPDEVIRRLGGKVERGTLVNGEFRVKQ